MDTESKNSGKGSLISTQATKENRPTYSLVARLECRSLRLAGRAPVRLLDAQYHDIMEGSKIQ